MKKHCLCCNNPINIDLPKYLGVGYKDYCSEHCLRSYQGSGYNRINRHTVLLSNGDSQWICGRQQCDICDEVIRKLEEGIAVNMEWESDRPQYRGLNQDVIDWNPLPMPTELQHDYWSCEMEHCYLCRTFETNNSIRLLGES